MTKVPEILNNKTVTAISAGFDYALALTNDGKITSWGLGYNPEILLVVPERYENETFKAIWLFSFCCV